MGPESVMYVVRSVTSSGLGFSIVMTHMKPHAVDPSARYHIEPSLLLLVVLACEVFFILPWVEAAEAINRISVIRIPRRNRAMSRDLWLLIVLTSFLLNERRLAWQMVAFKRFEFRPNSI
jgi:hypothetical protein